MSWKDRWFEESLEHRRLVESYSVVALVVVFTGLMLLVYKYQSTMTDRTACAGNLKLMIQAIEMYRQDYDGQYPLPDKWARSLVPYVDNLGIYVCPADEGAFRLRRKRQKSTDLTCSYWYSPPSSEAGDITKIPLVGDRMLPSLFSNHGEGGNAGYMDGHVSWRTSDQWFRMHLPTEQFVPQKPKRHLPWRKKSD